MVTMRPYVKVLLVLAIVALIACGVFVYHVGPRNIIGMLRYDQRHEGTLKVGDKAPEMGVMALDGGGRTSLLSHLAGRPLIFIFGSYT